MITLAYNAYIKKIVIRFELMNNIYILSTLLSFIKLKKNLETVSKVKIKAY